jgi:hypothetical protein
VVVLTALEAKLPAQAAIEHAIVASQHALDTLHDKSSTQGGGKATPAPHPTRAPSSQDGHGGGNPNP